MRTGCKNGVSKANHDLEAAHRTLKDDPLPDVACFHAQQCAEKYLKAFLTAHLREAEKTHDLLSLLEDCTRIEKTFDQELREACKRLNDYAVEARYPGILPDPDSSEARKAVESAAQVRDFV